MSWMDSWARPSKQLATPPPLYLTRGEDVPYCHSCGRVMSSKKSPKPQASGTKYCSDRCRHRKLGPIDRRIEKSIVSLLNAEEGSGIEKTDAERRKVKGDKRILVTMDEVEKVAFNRVRDPEKVFGRNKNRRRRGVKVSEEWLSVDMESGGDEKGASGRLERLWRDGDGDGDHVRLVQMESKVGFSVADERGKQERIKEDEVMKERRDEGQKRAEEREMVRRAARRGVVFGFVVDSRGGNGVVADKAAQGDRGGVELGVRRKCEALMNGSVVEPSFAKGNWALRWRE